MSNSRCDRYNIQHNSSSQPSSSKFAKKSRKLSFFSSTQPLSRSSVSTSKRIENIHGSNSALPGSTSQPWPKDHNMNLLDKTANQSFFNASTNPGENSNSVHSVFIVFLPFIHDENENPIKQPLLIKVKESQFLEFGFDIPFSEFFDEFKNIFEINLCNYVLQGQIIAIGENGIELKACLENCVKLNSEWKECRKMIGNAEIVCNLEFAPLQSSTDKPRTKVMDKKCFHDFVTAIKNYQVSTKVDKLKDSNKSDGTAVFTLESTQDQSNKGVQIGSKQTDCHCKDSENMKKINFEIIEKKIEHLNERQKLLSQLDLNSSILIELIDVVSMLKNLTIQKDSEEKYSKIQISKKDNTYKIKTKNRVFIEGLVEFSLDKYERSLKMAKQKNPFSFAYQLVKICFPEPYFANVTLGKKYYDKEEMEEFYEQKEIRSEKFPLAFVWGFKHPFDEPFKGDFDLNLGQERVRGLIEHILRKSDIFEYDEDLENKIRARIVKELCSKNKKFIKDQKTDEMDKVIEEVDEFELSDIWDSNCFD